MSVEPFPFVILLWNGSNRKLFHFYIHEGADNAILCKIQYESAELRE